MRNPADIYDEWLVLKCQSGDKEALSSLIEKWHHKVLSQAYFQIKDNEGAQDVVQEVWSAVINSIHKLKEPAKFKSWLYRIVYVKSIDWIREKQKVKKHLDKRWEVENELNAESKDETEANLQLILRALKDMNDQERLVIRLFYLESHSLKSIAEILDMPIGSVKSKMFYARERLKKLIKSKIYETQA